MSSSVDQSCLWHNSSNRSKTQTGNLSHKGPWQFKSMCYCRNLPNLQYFEQLVAKKAHLLATVCHCMKQITDPDIWNQYWSNIKGTVCQSLPSKRQSHRALVEKYQLSLIHHTKALHSAGSLTFLDAHLDEAHCSTSGPGQELSELRRYNQCKKHVRSVFHLPSTTAGGPMEKE